MSNEYGPLYQQGYASLDLENLSQALGQDASKLLDCQFGVQIADDGRVWVCVNGITFLRFKPHTVSHDGD